MQRISGINPNIVQLICEFINRDITPVVPKRICWRKWRPCSIKPYCLSINREGQVYYKGKEVRANYAIEQEGLKSAVLALKTAFPINGTAVMASLQSISTIEAKRLVKTADIISMLTLDGVKGTAKAHHPLISSLKPHPGQLNVVSNLEKY